MEKSGGFYEDLKAYEDIDLAIRMAMIGVKVVKNVDKSGFASISKPIQDKLAKDLGLSDDQKTKIVEEFTQTLEKVASKPKEYTYVSIEEFDASNWGAAGKLLG